MMAFFNGPGNELFDGAILVLLYDCILMWKDMFERNWKFKMSGYFCFRPWEWGQVDG